MNSIDSLIVGLRDEPGTADRRRTAYECPPRRAGACIPCGTTSNCACSRRPFRLHFTSVALSLSSRAQVYVTGAFHNLRATAGLVFIHYIDCPLNAYPHASLAMKFFSLAQALAAFSILSLTTVRLQVGALQLDPNSQGIFLSIRALLPQSLTYAPQARSKMYLRRSPGNSLRNMRRKTQREAIVSSVAILACCTLLTTGGRLVLCLALSWITGTTQVTISTMALFARG